MPTLLTSAQLSNPPKGLRLFLGHLVPLCPFIHLGRGAAFLGAYYVSGYFYTHQFTDNLPNNPSKWIDTVSLPITVGKLKLNEIMKQDQGHIDLGSWKESPGLPSPRTNAFCISGMPSFLRT